MIDDSSLEFFDVISDCCLSAFDYYASDFREYLSAFACFLIFGAYSGYYP